MVVLTQLLDSVEARRWLWASICCSQRLHFSLVIYPETLLGIYCRGHVKWRPESSMEVKVRLLREIDTSIHGPEYRHRVIDCRALHVVLLLLLNRLVLIFLLKFDFKFLDK